MIINFSKDHIRDLEKAINYQFSDISLVKEALSHPSLKQIDNSIHDYERFELLGDSILGFLITEMIFNKFTDYEEGIIAKIKAYVVSRDTLVNIAESIKLADYIIMTKGEENSGGRLNRNNIENTMEALLAAIYLDSDIACTRQVVTTLWADHIENIDFSSADPKTYLQEWLQSKNHTIPVYEVIDRTGPVHLPLFTVRVITNDQSEIGTGKSIKDAEKDAAKKLLLKINK